MPGTFRNISNSGRAVFNNVSNSGKAIFYTAPPGTTTTTTTSTTTTTTTGVQVWYTLERCNGLTIDYSTNYNAGTFAINDIVSYGGTLYFKVIGVNSSDPGGSHWSISATGLGVCPTTTTTTTTTTLAPVTFTAVASCNGLTAQIVVDNFAGGTGTYSWIASGSSAPNAISAVNGVGGTRYAITGPSYTFTNLAVNTNFYIAVKDSGGNNSAPVLVTTPTACTTTSTTTTTTTLANYEYGVVFCSDSSTGTIVSNVPLTRFNYYYNLTFGCFQVATNGTVVNLTGYNFTSIADCNAIECTL